LFVYEDMRLGLVVLFDWSIKDRCALAVLAGSRRIDTVGGRGVGWLVFHRLYRSRRFVLEMDRGLFLDRRHDGRSSGDVFRFRNGLGLGLLRLRASPIVCARVLALLRARV
jgi:hypothetical protein